MDSSLRPPIHGESESILISTVLPPPTELLGLAEAIDDSLGVYLAARTNWSQSTEWEALRYAVTMSNHALRNAEATLVLARNDMTLLSSAWATARVATESTLKMLWLLEPDNVWERESRWVACMDEGARGGAKGLLKSRPGGARWTEQLARFSTEIKQRLPKGTTVPGKPGNDVLARQHGPELEVMYVEASQFIHATYYGMQQWQKNLGDAAVFEETVRPIDWLTPLVMSWLAFREGAVTLAEVRWASTSDPFMEQRKHEIALADRWVQDARGRFLDACEADS